MRNIPALTHRETRAFFLSPFSHIVAAVYLVVFGIYFYGHFLGSWTLNLGGVFQQLALLTVFFLPLLTMRLFAEEKSSGTIEMLMTAPVTDAEVVIGKFIAALTFYAYMLVPTLAYYALVRYVGKPDPGPVIAHYLGALLVGGLYISVGFFTSTLTRSQVLSAFLAIVFLLMLFFLRPLAHLATGGDQTSTWYVVARYVSQIDHLGSFAKGILDVSDIVYFVSFIAYFLFLSVRSVETRKWS